MIDGEDSAREEEKIIPLLICGINSLVHEPDNLTERKSTD